MLVTVAVTPDFEPLTTSPISRSSSFKFTTPTLSVPDFSITPTTAPSSNPINFSPIMRSALVPDGPSNPVKVKDGKSGSLLSLDSNTPNNWTASGTFKLIFVSWTLVPKALWKVKPSLEVLVPTPDEVSEDLSIIKTFASFNFFCLLTVFVFRTVAKRFAFPDALLNATKVTVFLSSAIITWSHVNGSTDP